MLILKQQTDKINELNKNACKMSTHVDEIKELLLPNIRKMSLKAQKMPTIKFSILGEEEQSTNQKTQKKEQKSNTHNKHKQN